MSSPSSSPADASRLRVLRLAALGSIALAIALSYSNTLRVPLLMDDIDAILDNPSIREGPFSLNALRTPRDSGSTVAGRPVLNLTLALNYALSPPVPDTSGARTEGFRSLAMYRSLFPTDVRGFHLFNLSIHVLAAWTLFGLVRRTTSGPVLAGRWGERALLLAFVAALLWALHPLQTAAVTYIVQRAESLVSLFYLLTLYCLVRSADSARPLLWQSLGVLACLAGMGTKEVMVTAPLVALAYDRVYLAGSFAEALRRRGVFHLGLAATWGLLLYLVLHTGGRGSSAGIAAGVSSFNYLLTQAEAIVRYLGLTLWPGSLVFDYGQRVITDPRAVLPELILLAGAIAGIVWFGIRRPVYALPLAFFFVALAPSSSVVPVVTQTAAEHRVYLALAGLIIPAAALLVRLRPSPRLPLAIALALAVGLGWRTYARNADYASAKTLWADVVAKRPDNIRGRIWLGLALHQTGDTRGATEQWEEALRLGPEAATTLYILGNAKSAEGDHTTALRLLGEAARRDPGYGPARFDHGNELARVGRFEEAAAEFAAAAATGLRGGGVHNNLGNALLRLGRRDEAIIAFRRAVDVDPRNFAARLNLGAQLLLLGGAAEALPHLQVAAAERGTHARAHFILAEALSALGRHGEAASALETVLRLDPRFPTAETALTIARKRLHGSAEATP